MLNRKSLVPLTENQHAGRILKSGLIKLQVTYIAKSDLLFNENCSFTSNFNLKL